MMDLLDLRDVQLTYKLGEQALTVLKRVNLRVRQGEMVAILGPSGSGKSTLLYILGCLLKATKGSFHFAGHEVTSLTADELAELRSREIGFVFQQFHLLARAGILENVMLSAHYNHSDTRSAEELRAKAMSLIESVGLEEHIHHLPNQLSGGQQQRVAIARALMNDPALILADEPTGNLDSKSADQVLNLLGEIHRNGRTVIIITHAQEVARRCQRVVSIHDGVLEAAEKAGERPVPASLGDAGDVHLTWDAVLNHSRTAWRNLVRNKVRSALTMLGVTIGIAAVLSTLTLGTYTRSKILETYETLGVNKLVIRAYPRWNVKAKDLKGPKFEGVNQESDVKPMRHLFPEIALISPVIHDWVRSVEFGGRSFDQAKMIGVTPEYFPITNSVIAAGHAFTPYHVSAHSRVCVIGAEVAQKLFDRHSPLGQIIQINGNDSKQYSCLVTGVLMSQTSNNEWSNPNQQIVMPESFLALMASRWNSKPNELDIQMASGASAEDLSTKIKQFFNLKYGRSAQVNVDSDEILVAQMRRFLNLFAILLASVAFISLAVGGIGITNMMLVSVSERFKEIGLRKALGARDQEIRMQLLIESLILCLIAGCAGVVIGVAGYHSLLYLASKLFPKVHFDWVFNWPAIGLSVACIVVVGLASGIVPAVRAQKLEVVEALRSE